jgi:hypothetical protein
MPRLSITRVLVYAVLANWILFAMIRGKIEPAGTPLDGALAHPPVRQMVYPPSLLRAVDEITPRHDGALHIAWISASPAIYGRGDPNVQPGFIQEPVAAELSKRVGRPVEVEAYALENGVVLEKLLTTFRALKTNPDMIVVSLDHFDFGNRWISIPLYANFRIGLLTKEPLALFQGLAEWPYLHPSELAWALATLALPTLRYRYELGLDLKHWFSMLNPLNRPAGAAPPPPAVLVSPVFIFDAAYPNNRFEDRRDPALWKVGNEAVLDEMLNMIRSADIPALVYVDPTPVLNRPTLIGLEAALDRFKSKDPLMMIDPRALNGFIQGIDFVDSEHLRRPAPDMTKYLVDNLDALYRGRKEDK